MSLHVGSEIGTVSKRLATMSTAVRLLSGMGSHVSLKEPRPRESFPTYLTPVVKIMGEDVHR